MKEKVVVNQDPVEVTYTAKRFEILARLRVEARELIAGIGVAYAYGSLARGDVHEGSDIDIIAEPRPSYQLELALPPAISREIIMATPNAVPKAHLHINEYTVVTCPLLPFTKQEYEFYRFGGMCDLSGDPRVCGVNKKLLLIAPTPLGHVERSVVGIEAAVARELGVHVDIVNERVRVLSRRAAIGRTGVFLRVGLDDGDTFEGKLKEIADENAIVRRLVKIR